MPPKKQEGAELFGRFQVRRALNADLPEDERVAEPEPEPEDPNAANSGFTSVFAGARDKTNSSIGQLGPPER